MSTRLGPPHMKTSPLAAARAWLARRRQDREVADWVRRGRPVPPPHVVKQRTLRDVARRYGLKVLVETGTYLGDMVEALRDDFDRIYSIELGDELHRRAQERFRAYGHVEIIHGDSGVELSSLMRRIRQPALFWLDGHYSAGITARGARDTPVLDELRQIFQAPYEGHAILIDDAWCFGTDPAYPTLEELFAHVHALSPQVDVRVEDDRVRITPRSAAPAAVGPTRC